MIDLALHTVRAASSKVCWNFDSCVSRVDVTKAGAEAGGLPRGGRSVGGPGATLLVPLPPSKETKDGEI